MKRGDIWTASGGHDYAGKPRPVVIVQDNSFDATELRSPSAPSPPIRPTHRSFDYS